MQCMRMIILPCRFSNMDTSSSANATVKMSSIAPLTGVENEPLFMTCTVFTL